MIAQRWRAIAQQACRTHVIDSIEAAANCRRLECVVVRIAVRKGRLPHIDTAPQARRMRLKLNHKD